MTFSESPAAADKSLQKIELRLCTIDGSSWLESLDDFPENPPARFGRMMNWAIATRVRDSTSLEKLLASPAEGFVLAKSGIAFQSELVKALVHMLACAAIVSGKKNDRHTNRLEQFFCDFDEQGVPSKLRESGVVSVLRCNEAQDLASWINGIPEDELKSEITSAHGNDVLPAFLAALEDIYGTFTQAVPNHGCDVCILMPQTQPDSM